MESDVVLIVDGLPGYKSCPSNSDAITQEIPTCASNSPEESVSIAKGLVDDSELAVVLRS